MRLRWFVGVVVLLASWVLFGSGPEPVAGSAAAVSPETTVSTPQTSPPSSSSISATPTQSSIASSVPPRPAPGGLLGGCPNLPVNDVWHADVSRLPVHARSAQYVASIGAGRSVKADFGAAQWNGGPIGIPVTMSGATIRNALSKEPSSTAQSSAARMFSASATTCLSTNAVAAARRIVGHRLPLHPREHPRGDGDEDAEGEDPRTDGDHRVEAGPSEAKDKRKQESMLDLHGVIPSRVVAPVGSTESTTGCPDAI